MRIIVLGRVISSANNLSRVLCEDGAERLCAIKGKRIKSLRGSYNSLAAGDFVQVVPTENGRGLITALEPRRNSFGRYNEKGRADQAIAANVDRVVCVASCRLPPFRPRFVDRLAVLAAKAEVPFVIVINKMDLGLDEEAETRLREYASLGYGLVRTSVFEKMGLAELACLLSSGTSVLAGQSGAGKTSLLNALFPGLDRKTQEISLKYERGRHTTTMAEAVVAEPGRMVIDTPGFRRLSLKSLDPADLILGFPEFALPGVECEYGGRCTHTEEEGCAVWRAVSEGKIHPDRYESYVRIREEIEAPRKWLRSGTRDPGRLQRATIPGRKRPGFPLDPYDEGEEC
ncbi:MAG TPA: ribosome small subunit-dependent GTPase A [Rectinemataceae bacterium]